MGPTGETESNQRQPESLQKMWEQLVKDGLVDQDKLPREVHVDMVAKLCFANSVRSRLQRLHAQLSDVLAETAFLPEILADLAEGKYGKVYEVFSHNFGRLLWLMGQFEHVQHRTVSTSQFDALVAPLRAALLAEFPPMDNIPIEECRHTRNP